jgi:hypothetical protein
MMKKPPVPWRTSGKGAVLLRFQGASGNSWHLESVIRCPSNCPSKIRREARSGAPKAVELQRQLNTLGLDFQVRNQQVAGSIPAGGSSILGYLFFSRIWISDSTATASRRWW